MEPENSGNIGAIARVIKNFNFNKLILINPKADHLSKEAMDRATHAKSILRNAVVAKINVLKKYHTLVATTAKLGTSYNIPRSPLTPKQLSEKIKGVKKDVGIVFGREGIGLTNEEIKKCDFVVTIPSSQIYPTLNVSTSVSILVYELFQEISNKKSNDHITLISDNEKSVLLKMIDSLLKKLQFTTKEKRETQRIVWKRVVGKSFLTKREGFALMGFFKKLIEKLR
jgi:TrmH family RNA methyltransferase